MTYEEWKEKCEEHFGRQLSEKELTEAVLIQLSEKEDDREALEEQIESLRNEIRQLRSCLSEKIPSGMLKQCDEVLSIPANEHEITLKFAYGEMPKMDYTVYGIYFNEEV